MGIFSRLSKALESNLEALVERAEDPGRVLERAIDDLKAGRAELEQALISARTEQRLGERRRDEALREADLLERRAIQAIQVGDEGLARRILEQKLAAERRAETEHTALGTHATSVAELEQARRELEVRLREMPARKAALLARQASAEARGAVVGAGSSAQGAVSSALETFDRMEEKITRAEVEAEVRGQLRTPALDLRALEAHEADRALAELKARVLPALPPPTPKALPASTSVELDPVDESLAALKNKLGR